MSIKFDLATLSEQRCKQNGQSCKRHKRGSVIFIDLIAGQGKYFRRSAHSEPDVDNA